MRVASRIGNIYIEADPYALHIRVIDKDKTLETKVYDEEILELITAILTHAINGIKHRESALKSNIEQLSNQADEYRRKLQENHWSEAYKEELKKELYDIEREINETKKKLRSLNAAEMALLKALANLNQYLENKPPSKNQNP